jgi:hypothetical protein
MVTYRLRERTGGWLKIEEGEKELSWSGKWDAVAWIDERSVVVGRSTWEVEVVNVG